MASDPDPLDALDSSLIGSLRRAPHTSVSELARRLGIARGTVQSRLAPLERGGVVAGYGPDIAPAAAGFGVLAFTTLEIAQGSHQATVTQLARIPELLEIHTVTGPGDLLCRIVARPNDHLHEVLQRVVAVRTVVRSQTQLALTTEHQRTIADLVAASTVRSARRPTSSR